MVGIYSVIVETNISAAHILRGYEGACSQLHGHNWKIVAEVEASKLNEIGMVIDFKEVKHALLQIGKLIDHKHLNEISPFDKINPTAENIAAWFYKKLSKKLSEKHNNKNVKLKHITIYETEKSRARYYEK